MSKRVTLSEPQDDADRDLKNLLQRFIRKSEELEEKENNIIKQVELVQSAVASLQAWQENSNPSEATSSEPLHLDLKEIERETQQIREETERLQKEVKQKMEDNKRLKEEIERRNTLYGEVDDFMNDRVIKKLDERNFSQKSIETRAKPGASGPSYTPGIETFQRKLEKLKELEWKLKKEIELESGGARQKKVELLEKESREMFNRLKNKESRR